MTSRSGGTHSRPACWGSSGSPTTTGPRRCPGRTSRSPTARRASSCSSPLIPQRWYALKARLLGIERIADYDRSAPVSGQDVTFSYGEARELVLDAYDSFSPEAGRIVRRFFDEHWVDAPVRPHKRGGAFCSYTVPSVHPYVLLNYTARRRDVLTMAHELGHGLHAAIAAPQGLFHHSTPLTLAETASVFGEALVFGRLLDQAPDDDSRVGP